MPTSTDPYNYGQNSIEYNPNGDSYNGYMGSQSGGSLMNAASGGTAKASSNPFDAFLTHANAMYDFMNGGSYGGGTSPSLGQSPSSSQRPTIGLPNMGDPGYTLPWNNAGYAPPQTGQSPYGSIQFPQYNYPSDPTGPTRPGVTGSIGPQPADPWVLNSGPAPLDPNATRTPQPIGGTPSRPGIVGSIQQPNVSAYNDPRGFNQTTDPWVLNSGPAQLDPNAIRTPVPIGGVTDPRGLTQTTDPLVTNTIPSGPHRAVGSTQPTTPFTPVTGGVDTMAPVSGDSHSWYYDQKTGTWLNSAQDIQNAQQPQTAPATPAAPGATPPSMTAPQGGTVQDMIHQLLSPLFQRQQGDLSKSLNQNAAVTGDINSGGYSSGTGPSSYNAQMSNLMSQQGAQEGGYLQQANESALQRQLQLALGNLGLEGSKYSADRSLQGANAGAMAQLGSARSAYEANMARTNSDYNLGLGNMDVSRENNLMNFMAQMYGMTPQMLQALLASSPEALLTGQTVPTGNIIVKP